MTSNQVVNETSPVTLECVVGANPVDVLRITWYRVDDPDPDVELAGSKVEVVASVATSRLFIAHASSSNGGLYRCVAFNGLGAQVNATANVFVMRKYFSCGEAGGCTRRKRKWIYIAPTCEHLTFNELMYGSHSFTCKLHTNS